jgi:tetratricopeptide (TPR) repeat protein
MQAANARLDDARRAIQASGADSELIELCEQCLLPAKAARPRNAQKVAELMANYLASVEDRARAAQLAAAEERIKAIDARKAHRLTLALATSILLLGGLGVGGYLWNEKQVQHRLQQATNSINRKLDLARKLHAEAASAAVGDLSQWDEALSIVEVVHASAVESEVGEETLGRITSLQDDLQKERRLAAFRASDFEDERLMVKRFDELRLFVGQTEGTDWEDLDARYFEAFSDYGIDVEDHEDAVEVITESRFAVQLAAALADWSWVRRRFFGLESEEAKELLRIALAADPDPWREDLRRAVLTSDLSRLKHLAASSEADRFHSLTVNMLAAALREHGAHNESVDLLLRARERFPADFDLHQALATGLREQNPPDLHGSLQAAAVARSQQPQSVGALHAIALTMQRLEEVQGAAQIWREAIDLEPRLAFLHRHLGVALRQGGHLEQAEQACTQAMSMEPENLANHLALAGVLEDAGQDGRALEHYREAASLDPTSTTAQYGVGRMQIRRGDLEDGLQQLRAVLRQEPDHSQVRRSLGDGLLGLVGPVTALGAHRERILLLTEAASYLPQHPEVHLRLGWAYFYDEDYERAVDSFRKLIELRPEDDRWLQPMCSALDRLQRYAEGVDILRDFLHRYPNNAMAHFNLGFCLSKSGDKLGALQKYHDSLALDPGHAKALTNIGEILDAVPECKEKDRLLDQIALLPTTLTRGRILSCQIRVDRGHTQGVEEDLAELTTQTRDRSELHDIGKAQEELEDYSGVVATFQKAIELDPGYGHGYMHLGQAFEKLGQDDAALTALENSLGLGAGNEVDANDVAIAFGRLGDHERALRAYEEAIRINPGYALAHSNLGSQLFLVGDTEAAIQVTEKALRLDPTLDLAHVNLASYLAVNPEATAKEAQRAVELARRALELLEASSREHLFGYGWSVLSLAQYRTGNYPGSVQSGEKALFYYTEPSPRTLLILALSHHRFGSETQANEFFDQALEAIDQLEGEPEMDVEMLRSEVESLLGR